MDVLKRIREVIEAEANAINAVKVDESFALAVDEILACSGKVVTTGIGKAGHVAQKIAGTFSSTGTPSVFLHPAEAAHGDMGMLSHEDVILAFSTSGKSREVVETVKLARHFGVTKVISITSHPDSDLPEMSDVVLDMGLVDEPCRLKLTPTASTAVMMAMGDALAMAVMDMRGFTREAFGLRHHGGYLGGKAQLVDPLDAGT